jgi:uncharacterized protein YlxW (UPF0749 family)
MKKQEEEEPIVRQVQLLEDLIQRQQRLLGLANEIIDSKNRLIELSELEIEIYGAQNKRLTTILIVSTIGLICFTASTIIRLLA